MRILNGRDYYDSAMQHGADESVVFVRQKDLIISKQEASNLGLMKAEAGFTISKTMHDFNLLGNQTYSSANRIHIWLTGTMYRGIAFNFDNEHMVCWTKEEFLKFVETKKIKMSKFWYMRDRLTLDQYFTPTQHTNPALIDKKIVVATNFVKDEWKINGFDLKDFQFYKVKDVYTCYQEIDMYVSGILAFPGANIIEITDNNVKIAKHGFDKWSFRKPPQS